MKQQVKVHDVAFEQQMLEPYIVVLFEKVDVAVFCSATLSGHIREAVAGSCAYTDGVGETYSAIHEIVEHSAGEYSAHSSAFEN